MSIETRESITCPECGHTQDFMVWRSLNTTLDPEAKRQLLDGSLFRFRCDHCGEEHVVDYLMLYHDMRRRIMIHYVDNADNTDLSDVLALPGYRHRVVTDQNSLLEKVLIFEYDLDDRVIEILKLFLRNLLSKKRPEFRHAEARFMARGDGEYEIQFLGDDLPAVPFQPQLYDEIQTQFSPMLVAAGDRTPVIDEDWAARLLNV